MTIIKLLLMCCFSFYALNTFAAESVDLGRGELPLTVPSSYSEDTPSPLIILLHGFGSSGARQDFYMGVSKLADSYGFLFIAPDGTSSGDNQNRFWNATPACCDFSNTDVDDSSYLLNIINEIKSDYNIDPNRVYLIGHSNGGFMSYQTAYEHSDTIAAFASLAGASHNDERKAPDNPVHVLQIHGSEDSTINYEGGQNLNNPYPSALVSVSQWAIYNGCVDEGAEREIRDLDSGISGHESSVLLFAQGCMSGGSSELWTINGGSHIPSLSDTFSQQVIEWLYAHPKTNVSH